MAMKVTYQIMPFFILWLCIILTRGDNTASASFLPNQFVRNIPTAREERCDLLASRDKDRAIPPFHVTKTQLSLVSVTSYLNEDIETLYSTTASNDTSWSPGHFSDEIGMFNKNIGLLHETTYLDNEVRGSRENHDQASIFRERLLSAIKRFTSALSFARAIADITKDSWPRIGTALSFRTGRSNLFFTPEVRRKRKVKLVDITWLKAHEEVVSQDRVSSLKDVITKWGVYKLPLLVDAKSGAILDGHHRYAVGREMGLSKLPVILVDYLEDDSIEVDVWPNCGIDCLTKEQVIEMSLSDGVFPPKTSKHNFVSTLSPIRVPLRKLQ
mmetsp:Transcript_10122/g.12511  ORF Transcript_10122/g.12511 Transcript_10122/m.12511 type:complete len:327 (+) Transcript_10122:61-1041(+)|eukprot:CAMPEP_0172495644 /NCGR_PEP_ID=MMETSP1066-20121228/73871_1 /TAXON_ID=671091 /ORGANISM="Coscinodiscus wailesii, Strain CCMP2513" /LENGTH=326 /DNA_ID=CAMNT_0013267459 /DNA_START=61 /DNA_END=1041 /DNA_ORIENTATION=-